MEINVASSVAVIAVAAAVTAFVRAVPHLLFGGKREIPAAVTYLGAALPPAIMVVLVCYCLRNTDFGAWPFGLVELVSVAAVVLLQVFKKNTFLSVAAGTALYMLLIRL